MRGSPLSQSHAQAMVKTMTTSKSPAAASLLPPGRLVVGPSPDRKSSMTAVCDVSPVFIPSPDAPPGNVLPALARLLIDLRRKNLTNKSLPAMLEELPVDLVAPRMPSCSLN